MEIKARASLYVRLRKTVGCDQVTVLCGKFPNIGLHNLHSNGQTLDLNQVNNFGSQVVNKTDL